MIIKGSPVTVDIFGIKGIAEEVSDRDVVVSYIAKVDGAEKRIKQSYDINIVKVEDAHVEAQDVFQELEAKGMSKEEISELVNEGEEKFKEKAVLLGVLLSDN